MLEIERKYLVKKDLWLKTNKPKGEHILQGYLVSDYNKVIRVRVKGEEGTLTIKGKTINISRDEYEFPIPANIAAELIQKFAAGFIEKIRYTVYHNSKTWEVDEFLDNNEGLLLAEVELDSEKEIVELPDWIGIEVSGDSRYFNSNLQKYSFKSWKK